MERTTEKYSSMPVEYSVRLQTKTTLRIFEGTFKNKSKRRLMAAYRYTLLTLDSAEIFQSLFRVNSEPPCFRLLEASSQGPPPPRAP